MTIEAGTANCNEKISALNDTTVGRYTGDLDIVAEQVRSNRACRD
jgi:hypothetical protein